MNENPYLSPQSEDAPTRVDDDEDGVWRDGDLLVVRMRKFRFAPRCVKTNQPHTGDPTSVDLEWIPNRWVWALLFGAVGLGIARSIYGKKSTIRLPVSHDWLGAQTQSAGTGWSMIFGGILVFVASVIGYVVAMASGVDEDSLAWVMIILLVAPLVSIAGVVYLVVRNKPLATVRKMTEDYAWLGGISPDYLATLRAGLGRLKQRWRGLTSGSRCLTLVGGAHPSSSWVCWSVCRRVPRLISGVPRPA